MTVFSLRRSAPALLIALALILVAATPHTQVRGEYDLGTLGIVQSLLRLQTTASVIHTGAHPDDEDSALMARLARGDHARVAYLALNRGEGGQNTIGPELFEPLGVIRTEELLQARRLDGGEQLFTRTFDFGFSKTRAESAAAWNDETVLDDMVRALRTFRPLVVISRFSGTPADGHGHHQLAGYLTPIAVERAADPAAFPEQLAEGLRPWRTLKLFVSEGFRPSSDTTGVLRLDTGSLDPLLGRSYFEIAMEGRSQHRSQHQGGLELRGDRSTGVRLLKTEVGSNDAAGLFAGIDTSISGISQLAGASPGTLASVLPLVQFAVNRAVSMFNPLRPLDTVPTVAEGLRHLRDAEAAVASLGLSTAVSAEVTFRLSEKERDFEAALTKASGLAVDALADRETVAPGQMFVVNVRAFFPRGANVTVVDTQLIAPEGWTVQRLSPEAPNVSPPYRAAPEVPRASATFRVTLPPDARPTEPYWLREPRRGAVFVWPVGSPKGAPFDLPLLQARVELRIDGAIVVVERPVEFRLADPTRGELRRRLDVVPAVSVALGEPLLVIPVSARATERIVHALVENLTPSAAEGVLVLHAPSGWTVTPREQPFALEASGEHSAVRFVVRTPATVAPGEYQLDAAARVGEHTHERTLHAIAYPHIQTHRLYTAAQVSARVLDLAVPKVRVGYVMGTGDEVPSAIERMGIPVTMLDADALASGDLSRFDTIVIGIRASEVRPDLVANHKRLLEWVKGGGALIVQYQGADYLARALPPFAARLGGRVTDEKAPVTISRPQHAIFIRPNRIDAADWVGWVQDRSVNDWTALDPHYESLVESHDQDDPPETGVEVAAPLGRGIYVYSALAWFRQLPAGVPGAYRQFANLLALGERR